MAEKTEKEKLEKKREEMAKRLRVPRGKMKKVEVKFKFNLKNIILWSLVGFLFFSFLVSLAGPPVKEEEIPLSQALSDVKEEKVKDILVEGEKLVLTYKEEDKVFTSRKEGQETMVEILKNAEIDPKSVEIKVKDQSFSRIWVDLLGTFLPLVLMIVFFWFIFRQARGAQDSIFSFGRSKAKLFSKGKQQITFKDVGGIEEAKKELEEIVDFLKHPKKYRALGARTPKGALLVGPSGTGKTLLAKAVAGEAGVPFFSMAGSEFMEMLVGVGASRVRDLFSTAKKQAPSIIFIDEIDAIGRVRGMGVAGGHDEREQTLNQILVEMDGFTPNDHVIILAATNRGDLLDPALMRPGRFDRRVTLDMPDIEERKRILKIHSKGKPFTKEVTWEKVARRTVGFSGADLENMLNEAAILAARGNKKSIGMEEVEEAATKVKLGPEKKRLQSEEERKMTAYHEAGHAVVAHFLPTMDPVHRVSIVSRGLALGYTLIPPERDKYTETRTELLEKVVALLGGRASENLIFGEFTGGAASDIDNATRIVRRMVVQYGMSGLGPIYFGPQIETAEWGRAFIQPTELSDEMQGKVDGEIKKIMDECYGRAKKIIKERKKKLDSVAEKLMKQETVEDVEFEKIVGEKPKVRKKELKEEKE